MSWLDGNLTSISFTPLADDDVLEGRFTLDLEVRALVVISACQAFVKPPNVKMTGHGKSTTDALRVVIFYVSDVGTPFLNPMQ